MSYGETHYKKSRGEHPVKVGLVEARVVSGRWRFYIQIEGIRKETIGNLRDVISECILKQIKDFIAETERQVLHEMQNMLRGFFDPVVEQAFYEIIPRFPLGQVVTLSDGTEAVAVGFNPRFPLTPKVQCLRSPSGCKVESPSLEEIDLALHLDLRIVEVNGVDVRPFQVMHPDQAEASLALV